MGYSYVYRRYGLWDVISSLFIVKRYIYGLTNFELVVVDVVHFVKVKNHFDLSRWLFVVSLFSELSECANK